MCSLADDERRCSSLRDVRVGGGGWVDVNVQVQLEHEVDATSPQGSGWGGWGDVNVHVHLHHEVDAAPREIWGWGGWGDVNVYVQVHPEVDTTSRQGWGWGGWGDINVPVSRSIDHQYRVSKNLSITLLQMGRMARA